MSRNLESRNPCNGELLSSHPPLDAAALESRLAAAEAANAAWHDRPLPERIRLLADMSTLLERETGRLARLMSLEMGKPIREARAEVAKCALGCRHYAEHAQGYLRPEVIVSDATRSYVDCQPLGTILAIMPWNFPFWQVFRCAAPALAAGNTVLLKHAANVPQCALAIGELFERAGFPSGVFQTLLIEAVRAEALIADPRIMAVSLTGSEAAGRRVAAAAGAALKKSVLELGGSDPFVVLEDADLDLAAQTAVTARFQNSGQSCIAAKRFIVLDAVADAFLKRFQDSVEALVEGDPLKEETQVGPLARADLRAQLHQQVQESIALGARLLCGGRLPDGPGYFYPPTILDAVRPGMPAWSEELFGPVAALIRVADEEEALRVANDSRFGLGASAWTRDAARGERFIQRVESGLGFVNGMVRSDPRLPFGGVKASGYGRELSAHGLREFVNLRTIWIR